MTQAKGFMTLAVSVLVMSLISCSDFKKSDPEKRGGNQGPQSLNDNPFPPGSVYEKPNEGEFSEDKMLVNIGVNVVQDKARNFRLKSELFQVALKDACDNGMSDADLQMARSAWKESMLAFHAMEGLSFGPLKEENSSLHVRLYAWPFINPCGLDLESEAMLKGQSKAVADMGYNLKGLGAIEYLLFDDSAMTRLGPGEPKPKCNVKAFRHMEEWYKKPIADKKVDRCELAKKLLTDVVNAADFLDRRWNAQHGNYSKTMVDGSKYASIKEATEDLFHGMFAVERSKDERIGRPAGLHKLCTSDSKKCPEIGEHIFSGIAIEAVQAQFESFKEAFFGSKDPDTKAFGLDDFLIQKGRQDTVDLMRAAIAKVDKSLLDVKAAGSLRSQIEAMDVEACRSTTQDDRKVLVCGLYLDLKEVTTILKTDVLSVLSLTVPPGYQGDND